MKSGPDLEFEGTHPTVAVEYSQNRHNFMNNYRTGDDDSLEGFDSDDDEDDI